MKKIISVLLVGVAICFLFSVDASAYSFQLDFTATNFSSYIGDTTPSPETSISGSFGFEAASINSPIDALTSVDLMIAGFNYTLADITFKSPFGLVESIIGGIGGFPGDEANTVFWGSNDFWLQYDFTTLTPVDFLYSVDSVSTTGWRSEEFSRFDVSPVPEPSTFLLLGGGLAGLAFVVRRRRKE